jgi:hypothetical protein
MPRTKKAVTATPATTARRLPRTWSCSCSGRPLVDRRLEQTRHLADLGVHPGGGHHELAAPRVRTVFMWTVPNRSASGASAVTRPSSWRPASTHRQRRLVDLHGVRHDEPAVGGDAVAGLDEHDVAGHEVAASTSVTRPSRRMRAVDTSMLRSAARLFSARCSWTNPSTALNSSTTPMTIVSL